MKCNQTVEIIQCSDIADIRNKVNNTHKQSNTATSQQEH